MRIAHISDLHFAKISYGPGQFFSKRWLGNLNLMLRRGKAFCNKRPFKLIPKFKELGIEACLITGDFTSTGNQAEYTLAKNFVTALQDAHIAVYAIPGNHDTYTKSNAAEKTFFDYFPSRFWKSAFGLAENRCTVSKLTDGWWLLALDTTLATSLISSQGLFPEELEALLPKALAEIPKGEKVLMMNHFPFAQNERPRRRMLRGRALQAFLETHPQIQIYLHGHTHRLVLADLRPSNLPIVLDSASASHQELSSWNFIDLQKDVCNIQVWQWKNDNWNPTKQERFTF
ncbi:MAG: metallophosphoesterase [Chlamydiales bacterium]|nr:metallophosphoesterase [Chlamydiales bacterium]